MKNTVVPLYLLVLAFIVTSCVQKQEISSINPINWGKRIVQLPDLDSLTNGMTYLSVYSQIYSDTERRTHNSAATVSIRNISNSDSIYMINANYFDTKGSLIRSHFYQPIFISPLKRVEIIIRGCFKMSAGTDREGLCLLAKNILSFVS